jgi:hypothetical protein
VHQPGAHPWWSWYAIAGVSLREQEGTPAPVLRFPSATHEFMVLALDPGKPLPQIRNWEGASYLKPFDLVHQVELPGDEQAQEIVDLIVRRAVCDGMSLDEDNRARWQRSLDTTAQHYREGRH